MSILKFVLRQGFVFDGSLSDEPGPVDTQRSIATSKSLRTRLYRAIAIRVDEVVDLCCGLPSETTVFDLPTVAPPFPAAYFEFSSEAVSSDQTRRHLAFGVLVEGHRLEDKSGWELNLTTLFSGSRNAPPALLCETRITTASDGGISSVGIIDSITRHDELRPLSTAAEVVALFSISLMHCKNIELVELGAAHTRQEIRNAGPRRIRWHTLSIEPMARKLRAVRDSAEGGGSLSNALHLCRGHFKDYRQSGLFGRHKNVFWWDTNIRGNLDRGIVGKDYTITTQSAL